MTTDRFNDLVKEIRETSLDTLTKKNANYASSEDRLHNFKVGAAITGGTPAQAALGYMAKHLASLQDKVNRNDFHDREDLKEKVQDSINYLVFIWCCANEEREKYVQAQMSDASKYPHIEYPYANHPVVTNICESLEKRDTTADYNRTDGELL